MSATRRIYDVPLRPVLGSMFQPTGFPDLGAATFERFDRDGNGTAPALIVESVQSMANRLEAVGWDAATDAPVDAIRPLPYVRVVREGTDDFLTSSRLEAHRLASPFIHEAKYDGQLMRTVLGERLGLAKDTPLDYRRMSRAVAELDPLCLVHGVFFSHKDWLGQPKFPRAISALIEAHDVHRVASGGRKADRVRHQLDKAEAGGGTAEGYGSVPFHRTEWTAREIVASFVLDLELIRSYGLVEPLPELLEVLALWEVRSFLSKGLRLRTACDLELAGLVASRNGGEPLPELDSLDAQLRELVAQSGGALRDAKQFTVQWTGKGKG